MPNKNSTYLAFSWSITEVCMHFDEKSKPTCINVDMEYNSVIHTKNNQSYIYMYL